MKKFYPTSDPFARTVNTDNQMQSIGDAESIGMITDMDDTHEKDMKEIENFIPSPASSELPVDKLDNLLRSVSDTSTKVKAMPMGIGDLSDLEQKEEPVEQPVKEQEPVIEKPEMNTATEDSEPKFSDEELLPILDSILTKGYASYSFQIGKITAVMRTPFLWEDAMAIDLTERSISVNTLRSTADYHYQNYLLAANLEAFGSGYFDPLRYGTQEELEKSFQSRVRVIQSLPTLVVQVLWKKRVEFFQRVNAVLNDFDRLIEVF